MEILQESNNTLNSTPQEPNNTSNNDSTYSEIEMQNLYEQVKNNPETALQALKDKEMELNHDIKTVESEIARIRTEAEKNGETSVVELIDNLSKADTKEDIDRINLQIKQKENQLEKDIKNLFENNSVAVRSIMNEYGMK